MGGTTAPVTGSGSWPAWIASVSNPCCCISLAPLRARVPGDLPNATAQFTGNAPGGSDCAPPARPVRPAVRADIVGSVQQLADSTPILADPDMLRRRLAADGYLFLRGLLPVPAVRAA